MDGGRRNKWGCMCICLLSSEGRQINGIAWEPKTLRVFSGHINKSMAKTFIHLTSCQLLHTKGVTVAKMGEHEQLSHQYGIRYLKIWRTAAFTQLVLKSLKKTWSSLSKSSQKLSQNADRIFKYNSNLNNELRIIRELLSGCYLQRAERTHRSRPLVPGICVQA